jgi:hypothetical protein
MVEKDPEQDKTRHFVFDIHSFDFLIVVLEKDLKEDKN